MRRPAAWRFVLRASGLPVVRFTPRGARRRGPGPRGRPARARTGGGDRRDALLPEAVFFTFVFAFVFGMPLAWWGKLVYFYLSLHPIGGVILTVGTPGVVFWVLALGWDRIRFRYERTGDRVGVRREPVNRPGRTLPEKVRDGFFDAARWLNGTLEKRGRRRERSPPSRRPRFPPLPCLHGERRREGVRLRLPLRDAAPASGLTSQASGEGRTWLSSCHVEKAAHSDSSASLRRYSRCLLRVASTSGRQARAVSRWRMKARQSGFARL